MAKKTAGKKKSRSKAKTRVKPLPWLLSWAGFLALRGTTVLILTVLAMVLLYTFVNPPITHTIWTEKRRLGSVDRQWVPIEEVAPVMARSVVAAEDANFCLHWGFDVDAIRAAIDSGSGRGASTISQQVVKNVFLWQGRSWIRKALETAITPAVEAVWSKRRILEVYLNVAEMDEGVFGVDAAAQEYFDVTPDKLTSLQAARIAAVLPAPKSRSASKPSAKVRKRTAAIIDGAATIRADGRAACFED
ncbi:monofunctional biosynthetic peptidoglycan transglycosylase [Falsiruegeria mediterranea]